LSSLLGKNGAKGGTTMGMELFANRKIDEDTRILSSEYLKSGDYDLLIEKWFFEGIKAKSLIFISQQVQHLDNSEVENLARDILQLPEGERTTLKRGDEFTFFNFDFQT
jgi:hypothetical protein